MVGYNGLTDRAQRFEKWKGKLGVSRQQGGGVGIPAFLEGGELVGTLDAWNDVIPRFGSGGSVSMSQAPSANSQRFYDATNSTSPTNIVVVNAGGGEQSRGAQVSAQPSGEGPPKLSSGPSMAALSDIINRVSWSSVF